jgi:hypothetical protein
MAEAFEYRQLRVFIFPGDDLKRIEFATGSLARGGAWRRLPG